MQIPDPADHVLPSIVDPLMSWAIAYETGAGESGEAKLLDVARRRRSSRS